MLSFCHYVRRGKPITINNQFSFYFNMIILISVHFSNKYCVKDQHKKQKTAFIMIY